MSYNTTHITNVNKLDVSILLSTQGKQLDSCLLLKDITCQQEDVCQEVLSFYDVSPASEHIIREQKRILAYLKNLIITFLKSSSQ